MFWRQGLFGLIGFFSAVSFFLLIWLAAPGFFGGDWTRLRQLLEAYPGIEPFAIFILPVICIAGPAWLWRMGLIFKGKVCPQKKR